MMTLKNHRKEGNSKSKYNYRMKPDKNLEKLIKGDLYTVATSSRDNKVYILNNSTLRVHKVLSLQDYKGSYYENMMERDF